ncbi:hemin uptake protein HemP [Aquabacterium sp. OR-4]|uniref:hemin uptake protein HemP n=1 Tax=Aquabacterium sp. OR-4 TaxID=2978127 RepID=UPI0021B2552B|nr:hemin uptake protein HemP [Aquabacterium sp. OR-4]MDT7838109.1 hemin uptake protein HemP [Aquabacterium sp. OR-4]
MPTPNAPPPRRFDPQPVAAHSMPPSRLAERAAETLPAHADGLHTPSAHDPALPCWPSQELLGRGVEALIRHGDATYRLRLTRQGKLILTK